MTTSGTATYSVAVDWDDDGNYTGTYDELVGMAGYGVKSITITRGRDDYLADMAAGEATIVLHDPDGRFNPKNASSVLDGNLLPMRKVRIRATNDGGATNPGLFTGFIRTIEHDPAFDAPETTITCIDHFVRLDRAKQAVAVSGPGTVVVTTGYVVSYLAVLSGDVDSTSRISAGGDDLPRYGNGHVIYASGERSLLDEIAALLETERGTFWIGADGLPVYETRADRGTRVSSGTFSDSMSAMISSVDLDAVGNSITVVREDWTSGDSPTAAGTATASDSASATAYGEAEIATITSYYLDTDTQAQALANYLVGQKSSPAGRVYSFELANSSGSVLTHMLNRELQDRITVNATRGNTSGDYHIESIRHEIAEGGLLHRVSWGLSERGFDPFVIGYSTIGGSDLITY